MEAALAALNWMSRGHGYELTGLDVCDAYDYAMEAALRIGQTAVIKTRIEQVLAGGGQQAKWMRHALGTTRIPQL